MTIELQLPNALQSMHPVFNFSLLKTDPRTCALRLAEPDPQAILVDGEEHHQATEILDTKLKHHVLFYLIKWRAFPLGQSKWI